MDEIQMTTLLAGLCIISRIFIFKPELLSIIIIYLFYGKNLTNGQHTLADGVCCHIKIRTRVVYMDNDHQVACSASILTFSRKGLPYRTMDVMTWK